MKPAMRKRIDGLLEKTRALRPVPPYNGGPLGERINDLVLCLGAENYALRLVIADLLAEMDARAGGGRSQPGGYVHLQAAKGVTP